MEFTIKSEKVIEVKTLQVKADVRYWEDAAVNGVEDEDGKLIPCRKGNLWCPTIDFETGQILNWNKGVKADIHFKICDQGSYYLKDGNGETVLALEEDYVPEAMSPGGNGYGDYIIMNVDENGFIKDWYSTIEGLINEDE